MTRAQRAWLMRREPGGLWFDACAAQGWDYDDHAQRHAIYAELHREGKIKGARAADFDNDDFTAVKARLLLLADNLNGAIEDRNPDLNKRRTLVWAIHQHPRAYWEKIARARFQGVTDLAALSLRDLEQLRNTLNARRPRRARRDTTNEPF
jgi:hypothetical protein